MAAFGTFDLIRHVKARSRWKSPDVPEYNPKWEVRFYVGQAKPIQKTAKLYAICEKCLAAKSPEADRPNCGCIQAVRKWAAAWLKTHTDLMQKGELEALANLTAPKKYATPQEAAELYLKRGPGDRAKRVHSLKAIYEQTTGRSFDQAKWPELTEGLLLDWAELRQEAGRRGWLGGARGKNMPKDGWANLRALKAAGNLPALDRRTAAPWNTTISGYATNAKTIFGEDSRQHVLRELKLPDLEDFLKTRLKLPTPKGHKAIDAKRWEAMLEAEDELKREDLRLWVVHELLLRLSCRPIEVVAARPSWLERVGNRTRIVIVNRKDEGFTLKAGANGRERAIWLPDALVAAIERVALPERTETRTLRTGGERTKVLPASLIGAKDVTEARELVYYKHSQWMRRFVPEGSQTNYLLRHSGAAERMTSGDSTKAAALLGHSTSALVETRYGKVLETLEPVTDDEILRRVA